MDNGQEKRMIDTYEVLQAIHIGDKEVLFCEDKTAEYRYMCCYYTCGSIVDSAFDGEGSNDYLEIMQLFCERVQGQIEQVRTEQIPGMDIITSDKCYPDDCGESINGKVVAMSADSLRGEYRSADRQLYLVTGGFGAEANSRGSAVYCTNLYHGGHARFERRDVQGIVKAEHMPEWTHKKLEALKKIQARKRSEQEAR